MTTALALHNNWYTIIDLVTQSVDSPHSKRAYSRALLAFLDWYELNGRPGFTKATVNAYREQLLSDGMSRSSINQALSAIRKLASEAADNGLVAQQLAYGVERVKGVKQEGLRAGNWLTRDQAEAFVNTPITLFKQEEVPYLTALRDQAILSVMVGTGLRRSETAGLTWQHIQQRDGRWAIIDLIGKRGRVRSIGVPPWVKIALDNWAIASQIQEKNIFLALNKGGALSGVNNTKGGGKTNGNMSPQAIYNVIKKYALACPTVPTQTALAAHDLRRTAAALALQGGADLRQIQQMLGHASIMTTERYLEPMRSLQVTASDFIQIHLDSATLP
jgi:site-specific recombinase XerD